MATTNVLEMHPCAFSNAFDLLSAFVKKEINDAAAVEKKERRTWPKKRYDVAWNAMGTQCGTRQETQWIQWTLTLKKWIQHIFEVEYKRGPVILGILGIPSQTCL